MVVVDVVERVVEGSVELDGEGGWVGGGLGEAHGEGGEMGGGGEAGGEGGGGIGLGVKKREGKRVIIGGTGEGLGVQEEVPWKHIEGGRYPNKEIRLLLANTYITFLSSPKTKSLYSILTFKPTCSLFELTSLFILTLHLTILLKGVLITDLWAYLENYYFYW